MAGSIERAARLWTPWRIARWTAALVLLLVPAVMMRVSSDWHWGIGSFVVAGVMIGGVGLLSNSPKRRAAAAPIARASPSRW